MAKTLAEILADAAADDNLEFAAADGTKIKLADIKGFRSSVDTENQAAARARKEAERLAGEAKTLFDSLKAAQDEMNRNTPKQDDKPAKGSDWKKNPLYDEIVPVFESLEATAKQIAEENKRISKSLELSQATYAAERLRREWAEAKVKPKDKKFEEVVQEVINAREVDEFGLPTLSKYLHRATEQDRMEAYAAEKVAAAQKDWEKKAHVAAIPKPGKFQTRKNADAPIKKLEDLNSETVANDPRFRNS